MTETFSCEACKYSTIRKYDYTNHLLSKKHIRNTNPEPKESICKNCSKIFSSPSGLWKHSLKCLSADNKIDRKPTISFFDFINRIRINSDYIETYNDDDHDSKIFKLFKDCFDSLSVNDIPIITKKQNDSNCHIIYIYHNNCWKKETELEILKQLIYDYEDDTEINQQPLLLRGLIKFINNTLEDILIQYPTNKRLFKKNQYNLNYIKNKMAWLNFIFNLTSVNT